MYDVGKEGNNVNDIQQVEEMIRITDKSRCCGCTACMSICPVQCIVMRRDREGFDYPVANPDLCISCGRCEEICPMTSDKEAAGHLEAIAARNAEFMHGSSSGGVFPVLARKVIDAGGSVYGAVMNPDLTVSHAEASDMSGIEAMRGSKYVQSELYAAYDDVRCSLEQGQKIMFTGTPCQVAGLKSYLGRDHEDLLLVDCACHGVPGPGLWEKYVKALGKKYRMPINEISFRGKERSWRKYEFVVSGPQHKVSVPHAKDPYMLLFLQDMTLRPSCYACPLRNGGSGSDLTLADLWNVAEVAPEMNDDKGASLILVNTEKGRRMLETVSLDAVPVDSAVAKKRNGAFGSSPAVPDRRTEFFQGVHSAEDLVRYMKGFVVRKPVYARVYGYIHSLLAGLKRRIRK